MAIRAQPKLNFRGLSAAVGREGDLQVLTDALKDVFAATAAATDDSSNSAALVDESPYENNDDGNNNHWRGPQCVFLEGASGSGKTYLVEQWWQQQSDAGALYGSGKFDQKQEAAVPYSAFVEAVSKLVHQLPADTLQMIRIRLDKEERQLLINFFPVLSCIGDDAHEENAIDPKPKDTSQHHTEEAKKPKKKRMSTFPIPRRSFSKSGVTKILSMGRNSFIRRKNRDEKEESQEAETRESDSPDPTLFNDFESSSLGYSEELSEALRNPNPSNRLSYVLGEFLSCLEAPSVVFLDDLQWSDKASIHLLHMLLANRKLSRLLLVLASRPAAAGTETDRLSSLDTSENIVFQDALKSSMESTHRTLHHIVIGSLNVDGSTKIVSALTELREELCRDLALVVHQKCGGNPFFLLRFLESSHRRQLLKYDLQQYRWTWDIAEIQAQTDLAENVASSVREGITQVLDGETLEVLRIASRIGFSFHVEDVSYVAYGLKRSDIQDPFDFLLRRYKGDTEEQQSPAAATDDNNLHQQIFQKALEENLIDDQGDGKFKFSHDQILQCFLVMNHSTVNKEDENLRLGVLLLSLFWSHQKTWALFAGLKLLALSSEHFPKECKAILIREYSHAADKAFKKSAFDDAADYSGTAVQLLESLGDDDDDDTWDRTKATFYIKAATHSLACGRHDRCNKWAQAMVDNTQDQGQKLDAYLLLASSLRFQSKFDDSNAAVLVALKELGEKLPISHTNIFEKAFRLKKKNDAAISEDDILQLPLMTDSSEKRKVKLLVLLYLNAYDSVDHSKMKFALERLLAVTQEAGLCQYTPLIMAAHAYNLANRGDFIEGSKVGNLAMKLVDTLVDAKDNLPLVTFFLVTCVNHLRTPMFKSLPDLKRGYRTGMEHGDSHSAFLCATTEVCFQFLMGNSLKENAEAATNYFRVAHEYGQKSLEQEILLMWQLCTNLMGNPKHDGDDGDDTYNPNPFDGKAMDEVAVMREGTRNGSPLQFYVLYLKNQGNCYFGLWEEPESAFCKVFTKYDPKNTRSSHYSTGFICAFTAIVGYKTFPVSKKKETLAVADTSMQVLKTWVEKGAINMAGALSLCQAQKAAMDQPLETVKPLFDNAIVGLHRCGFRNLEGLACINFAEFAIQKGDRAWAADYIKRGCKTYSEWGAAAVVRRIEKKYAAVLAEAAAAPSRSSS